MLESLLATLAGKIAAGGFAVALAAVPVAATGNFPDQAQTGISQAVENIGIHIPLGDTAEEELLEAEAAVQAAGDAAEDGVDGEVNENAAFGQGVAADAKDGGVDGQEVSEAARAQAEERKAAGQAHRPEDAGQSTDAGAPEDVGSQSQTGLDTASDTPAASHIPASVPGGKPAGVGRP